MKRILAFMIVIIELLCFCNINIAMAISDMNNAEVQQDVIENTIKGDSFEESAEKKNT